ncbi:unnamed protein product [Urochloa decumbens]|uniref:Uncharacterized protein n=1 Tax=Urochloa decumbens TaxID=240449 RepID=A0ABC9ACK4_9POAL
MLTAHLALESSSDKGDLSKPQILPIRRPGFGRNGAPIRLRTNHFKASVDSRDVIFYHYNVILKYEDDKLVIRKGVGRQVIDKLQEIYASDLANMDFFACDGEKNLYTTGALPNVKNVFTVALVDASSAKAPGGDGSPEGGDTKRMKRLMQAKTFKVELSLVEKHPKVPLDAITKFIRGQQSDDYQEGLQILDIILRQHSARQFPLKQRNGNGSDTIEVTVYDYYLKQWGIKLKDSVNFPCLNVGKPERPTYLPIELCNLVSLQRYTKALTVLQRSSLVQNSRQNPSERKLALSSALKLSNYNSDGMLKKCGISIASEFTQVDGRVLEAPKQIDREDAVIEENPRMRLEPAPKRVDDMFAQLKRRFPDHRPAFLLCVLPERKNCSIYGPWKRACLADFGTIMQCLGPPPKKINDQYLTNMLLKINAKLGGLNSLLQMKVNPAIPLVSRVPTMILGMDVSHGSSVCRVPSVVAVVGSLGWPLISRYSARVCTQEPLHEMIDSLFKLEGVVDRGLIKELIEDFSNSLEKKQLPQQIIIFRDGVSEGQFTQVLNDELPHIIEACKFFYDSWSPKLMAIVAQKNHHTRFFRDGNNVANVDAGTVVDKGICHCRNYDFYMCAHTGMIGTTRPTHYHVLYDEIGFTPDDLQALVHSLSYVYQRSTSAVSLVGGSAGAAVRQVR